MINFRNIFNLNYSYLGLIPIIILIILIIILNNNTPKTLKTLGTVLLVAGLLSLLISMPLNLGINLIIPTTYKIFIQIISDKLFKTITYISIIIIVIGIILKIIERKLIKN